MSEYGAWKSDSAKSGLGGRAATPTPEERGRPASVMSATLQRVGPLGLTPVAGKNVNFSITLAGQKVTICDAKTNAQGVAVCGGSVQTLALPVLGLGYNATYAGDADFQPATAKGELIKLG